MPIEIAPTNDEMESVTRASLEVMAAALGPERFREMFGRLSSTDGFLRAPLTTMERLRQLIEGAPPVDEAALGRFARRRVRRINDITSRGIATSPLFQHPRTRNVVDFLQTQAAHVDVERVEDLFMRGTIHVLLPAEAIPAMVFEPQNLFEPTVKEAARFMQEAIEGWYKDFVIFLVNLSCTARGQHLPRRLRTGRATLGNWMVDARELWTASAGPLLALEGDLCSIRNAFSHESLDIDVRKETVASPLDKKRALNRREFAAFTHKTFWILCSLWGALLTWRHQNEVAALPLRSGRTRRASAAITPGDTKAAVVVSRRDSPTEGPDR